MADLVVLHVVSDVQSSLAPDCALLPALGGCCAKLPWVAERCASWCVRAALCAHKCEGLSAVVACAVLVLLIGCAAQEPLAQKLCHMCVYLALAGCWRALWLDPVLPSCCARK